MPAMSYTQLTREERYVIAHLKMFKLSLREIARRLGRPNSTRSSEIKRNVTASTRWVYWYDDAHPRALERRTRARHHRRRDNGALYEYVAQRLRARWSPECIAGRLALDYPAQPAMRVSPEAILTLDRPRCESRRTALPLPVPCPQAPAQAAPLRQPARIDPRTRVHSRAPRRGG